MFFAIAMLCAVSVSPTDCNRSNAVAYIPLGTAKSEIDCMMGGQVTLAAIAIGADSKHLWVVKCEAETSIGKDTTG